MSTREERIAKLAETETKIRSLVSEYNEKIGDDKAAEAYRLKPDIDKLLSDYAEDARVICFGDCRDSADPMLEAIKELTYEVVSVKEIKSKDGGVPRLEVGSKNRNIDLRQLHKFINDGIGADKKWIYMIEQFNFRMTCRVAMEIGYTPERMKEISDSYAMSAVAKEIALAKSDKKGAKAPDPTSNGQILKTLQGIVDAMLGAGKFKATSKDVKYIEWIYGKKNNKQALTVSCANHKFLTQYIAEVCHHLVTGADYCADYKAAKA